MTKKRVVTSSIKSEIQRVTPGIEEIEGGVPESEITVMGEALSMAATMGPTSGPRLEFRITFPDPTVPQGGLLHQPRGVDAVTYLTLEHGEHLLQQLTELVAWLKEAQKLPTRKAFTVQG